MSNLVMPESCKLEDLPEFQRFQSSNPGKRLDEVQTAIMFSRAIHWISIYEILWPNFESVSYYSVEVKTIVFNDPDRQNLPPGFYKQVAEILSMFWRMKLESLYPNGDWEVNIHRDPEITVDALIRKRQ